MISDYLELLQKHKLLLSSRVETPQSSLPRPWTDHRQLQPEDCFIAIKGENFDGHKVIPAALSKGASLIIGEDSQATIQVADSRKAAALYAYLYNGRPAEKFKLYGVTGTNGKTTVSLMLYQILRRLGHSCGWIGTLGYKINDTHYNTQHTTPDILQLHQIFKEMADAQVQDVVMEVSSHALALDRVYNVNFDLCLFTNLSRDHLDFHKDMDAYFAAKYLLFERAMQNSAISVINIDDEHGAVIAQRVRANGAQLFTLGRQAQADWQIIDADTQLDHSSFGLIDQRQQIIKIQSPLIGSFNIDNLALAMVTLLAEHHSAAILCEVIPELHSVPGRIEAVANNKGIGVYVDYAHTPDALINLLKSINKLPHGRIISIIGAGGNRDQGKRPLMLQAALRHSDAVIITDDNPRYENPNQIVRDIARDRDLALPWWIIRDRHVAIQSAIRMAEAGDIVLICGKGHENYQEIKGIRYDFDDRQVAAAALQRTIAAKAEDELILPLDPLMLTILMEEEIHAEADPGLQSYRYLCTDSRKVKPGSLFFALEGEHFDGNSFIPGLLAESDCFAVGSVPSLSHERYFYTKEPVLLMAKTLQKYIQMFDIYVLALTGSTGKTSTKEILANILGRHRPTIKTLKNENNIIGLCKSILRIEPEHRFAVLELGTNHFGEISLLADTIRPDAGIILNVGPSHLEYFGDEEGVFKEKTELFHRALDLRLYPADDLRFEGYRESGKSVGFSPAADYPISHLAATQQGQSFVLSGQDYAIPYQAAHLVINSAFAIAAALHLQIPFQSIQAALQLPVELDMRMQIEDHQGSWLIVDCYNANPVSMQAAIEFWRDWHPELPHIAFLGDMLELGEQAAMYHNMVAAMLAEAKAEAIFSVGHYAQVYNPDPSHHYATVDDLLQDFPLLPTEAVLLIKASHGIHLEKVLPILRGAH